MWIIDALGDGIELAHLPGNAPGGLIRAVANRRVIVTNDGSYSSTESQYANNPPELVAIVSTTDSYAYPSTKTRTVITRGPARQFVPSTTSIGFAVGETVEETYSYSGIVPAQGEECLTDILSATLQSVVVETTRLLGSFSDYVKYLSDRNQAINAFARVVASRVVRTYQYDSKGRTIGRTESTYEDPRALAGSVRGVDWSTQFTAGLSLTRQVVESWREVRAGDWEYARRTSESWARAAPNAIPPGASLAVQIQPVITESLRSTSTSQNQPPAAERSPARFSESSQTQQVKVWFADPADPFRPKERTYVFDLLPALSGSLSLGGPSLYELGLLAGQFEFGEAQQVEITSALSANWFSYHPYQSIRVDEPSESGIYAISSATFVLDASEFVVSFRGLLVATVDAEGGVIRPYPPPPIELQGIVVGAAATMSGTLTGPAVEMAGVLQAQSATASGGITVQLTLSLTGSLAAASATASGELFGVNGVFGAISSGSAMVSGALVAGNILSGELEGQSAILAGLLAVPISLFGSLFADPAILQGLISGDIVITRASTIFTTSNLSAGGRQSTTITLDGKTVGIYRISVDSGSVTVRIYGNAPSQLADTRTALSSPVPDGVLLLSQATLSAGSVVAAAVALGVNTDNTTSYPITIDSASGGVSAITIDYLVIEV